MPGGALETVIDGQTGLHFREQDPGSLAAALQEVARLSFAPEALRAHAQGFDTIVFEERMRCLIADAMQEHQHNNSAHSIRRRSLVGDKSPNHPFHLASLANMIESERVE